MLEMVQLVLCLYVGSTSGQHCSSAISCKASQGVACSKADKEAGRRQNWAGGGEEWAHTVGETNRGFHHQNSWERVD